MYGYGHHLHMFKFEYSNMDTKSTASNTIYFIQILKPFGRSVRKYRYRWHNYRRAHKSSAA